MTTYCPWFGQLPGDARRTQSHCIFGYPCTCVHLGGSVSVVAYLLILFNILQSNVRPGRCKTVIGPLGTGLASVVGSADAVRSASMRAARVNNLYMMRQQWLSLVLYRCDDVSVVTMFRLRLLFWMGVYF